MENRFIEKRKFGRRSVFKPAFVIQPNGERISGLVIDIADGGARFKTADPDKIARNVVLEIPVDDFIVECEVVHYLADAVGLQYVASPKKMSWRPPERKRILRLRD